MSKQYDWTKHNTHLDRSVRNTAPNGRKIVTDAGGMRPRITPELTRADLDKRSTPANRSAAQNDAADDEPTGDELAEFRRWREQTQPNTQRDDTPDRRYLAFPEAHGSDAETKEKRAVSIIFGKASRNEERELLADFCRAVVADSRQPHAHAKSEWNKRLLSAGTDSAGGYTIPPGYLSMLISDPPPMTSLYALAQKIPVKTNEGVHPTISSVPTVSYGGETVAFGDTNPVFGQGTYEIFRRSAKTELTNNLIEDSGLEIVNVVQGLLKDAMMIERERATAIGTGTNEPTGIYHSSGITDVSGVTEISYANLNKLLFRVDLRWQQSPRCVWSMNQTVMGVCSGLVNAHGTPIFTLNPTEGMRPYLLGKPIVPNNSLPNNYIGIGAFENFCVWDRGIFLLDTTREAGDAWSKNQTYIRISERQGSRYQAPPSSTAFVRSRLLTGIS